MTTRPMTVTFVLTGANAGRTMNYRGEHLFINGRMRYTNQAHIIATVAARLSFIGAYMMGTPELEAALAAGLVTQEQVNGTLPVDAAPGSGPTAGLQRVVQDERPNVAEGDAARRDVDAGTEAGKAGIGADGNRLGSNAARPGLEVERLIGALRRLDPSVDDQWTDAGKPKVDAVAAIYGQGVTRQMIEAAIPGFNREVAQLG